MAHQEKMQARDRGLAAALQRGQVAPGADAGSALLTDAPKSVAEGQVS